jgi:hypothetical protein
MKYHCDALLPRNERYSSFKFRRLSRKFNIRKQEKAHLLELTIFALTPGLNLNHVGLMMHWDNLRLHYVRTIVVPHYAVEAQHYTHDNYASITLDDGRAMLQSILDGKPNRAGTMPMHVTRYLQSRRLRGATAKSLAEEFNTTPARISRWWSADIFDPLSGLPRDPHTMVGTRHYRPRLGVVI